ncbi:MAG: ATP-NAD kinase family protein [Promethearchaeota archaeon]|jgi:predicted polyphosphate/ATP-dependent NAD kinase
MKKIGLIINPIAGMGGSVGLKGTDGDIFKKALELGANPVAPGRIYEFLLNLKNRRQVNFITAPGNMGAEYLENKDFDYEIIGTIPSVTTAEDTKRIARKIVQSSVELLVFCGGDGTARDIYDAIGLEKPVIAIPAGVKMYSSVFALNPRAAAQLVDEFLEGTIEIDEREVLDIDEELFRKNILEARLYGYLKVLKVYRLIQSAKSGSSLTRTVMENQHEIAQFIVESMQHNILYLLGPGTTVKAITDNLNLTKTLLGVDAIYNKKLIGVDLNEKGITELIEKYSNSEIIISPLGGQGFIFGRGNKQFTPTVIKLVGTKNIKIIGTSDKIREFECLKVDTGNLKVDQMLSGFAKVIIGYMEEFIIPVEC